MKAPVKYIHLSNGGEVIVDFNDFDGLAKYKWYRHDYGYAVRKPRGFPAIYMHRVITKCPKHLEVDHINRNPLDNRKENLRTVQHWVNMHNRPKQMNNTTGFKDVFITRNGKRWYTIKRVMGKPIYGGTFDTPEQAYRSYENL